MPDYNEGYRRGFGDGYQQAQLDIGMMQLGPTIPNPVNQLQPPLTYAQRHYPEAVAMPKKKRKVSAYHKRLGREIKALRKRHMTKAGKWKKGWSQKRMMKAAHKAAK